jgi:hypothetical protein
MEISENSGFALPQTTISMLRNLAQGKAGLSYLRDPPAPKDLAKPASIGKG